MIIKLKSLQPANSRLITTVVTEMVISRLIAILVKMLIAIRKLTFSAVNKKTK